ncbi:hypothetical protein DGG96_14415 [Legionella qingyii]|uniref:Uncharacterized protein n=1 Tax=Legionella qingyii TaxID=2184757 RepID=A0A317U3R6_9GAMM|nr:hypothetical protein [Legionella qingyii]PWY54990.1 hypothetical protein DGG96_14415 [Legionella qingyii]RUR21029.1 hypothetical protein ELY20_13875 [Legionella qingyii]RUR27880.1 hypothetical protein ELY16_03640 [Legionella qingyii]
MSNLGQITSDLINAIAEDLKDKPPKTSDNAALLIQIEKHVDKAFSSVEKEEQKALFKKLALVFHPDKIEQSQPKLHERLKKHNITDEIFKIISNRYKEDNLLGNFEADPFEAGEALWKKINELFLYHFLLYQRYYQPFRSLANTASWIINIGLILAEVSLIITGFLILKLTSLADGINNWLFNLFAGEQFAKEIENYKRNTEQTRTNDENYPGVFTKMQLQAKAIVKSIISPLPEGFFNKLGAIFITRPLTVLLVPVFLIVSPAAKLVIITDVLLFLAASFTLLGIKLATLAIINAPIYGLDLIRLGVSELKAYFQKEKPVQEKEPNSSSRLLIGYLPPSQEVHAERSSVPPVQSRNRLFPREIPSTGLEHKYELPSQICISNRDTESLLNLPNL